MVRGQAVAAEVLGRQVQGYGSVAPQGQPMVNRTFYHLWVVQAAVVVDQAVVSTVVAAVVAAELS
jgi:hypothetical protein